MGMATGSLQATALDPGIWEPRGWPSAGEPAAALLVTDGLLVRELLVADDGAAQLLGPGDVAGIIRAPDELLPIGVRWTVAVPSRVVPLGRNLLNALREAPELAAELLGRGLQQHERQAAHRAIVQLPRVEQRVLGLLWLLAERYGRVTPAGVLVPVSLTHALLGRLVGARRSTVTLAIKALATDGSLTRRADGLWLLAPEGVAQFAPVGEVRRAPSPIIAEPEVVRATPGLRELHARLEALRERIGVVHERRELTFARTEVVLDRSRATRQQIAQARERRARERELSRPGLR